MNIVKTTMLKKIKKIKSGIKFQKYSTLKKALK